MRNRRGFTLVELITALVLVGLVGTAIYQLLVSNQRLYREQAQRVDVNQNARAAISILPGEVRELNAADPAGSDIISMTASSMRFKAMRSLYFLCQPPDVDDLEIMLDATSVYGLRPLQEDRDSVLLFAENSPDTRGDDGWVHANVVSVNDGTDCPNNGDSFRVRLEGITQAALGGVESGAPVRGFEVVELSLYPDMAGDTWLGLENGASNVVQPIVGPLSAQGLRLEYYDDAGNTAATAADVARITIAVESRGTELVQGTAAPGPEFLLQDLLTQVAVRNNPTY